MRKHFLQYISTIQVITFKQFSNIVHTEIHHGNNNNTHRRLKILQFEKFKTSVKNIVKNVCKLTNYIYIKRNNSNRRKQVHNTAFPLLKRYTPVQKISSQKCLC